MPTTVIRAGSYRPRSTSIATLGGSKVNWNRRGLNRAGSQQGASMANQALHSAMARGMSGVGYLEFGDRMTQGIVYGSSRGLGGKNFCEGAGAPTTSAILQIVGTGMSLYGGQTSKATYNKATKEMTPGEASNPTLESGGAVVTTAGQSIMDQCNARNAAATGDADAIAAAQTQASADLYTGMNAGNNSGAVDGAAGEEWVSGVKNEYLMLGAAGLVLLFIATKK